MASIYIHIPFCKQACHYCDFHFSTVLSQRSEMVSALRKEIALRKDALSTLSIQSIYFGGGTPSLLSLGELASIMETVHQYFEVEAQAEITLEANPDDVTRDKLMGFKSLGINRLSMGIQTFHEPFLRWMNRAHTSAEAEACIQIAQEVGFDDLTLDLIYAIPSEDHRIFEQDLDRFFAIKPNHLSAYNLTIEPGTMFGKQAAQGKLSEVDDDFANAQMEMLMDRAAKEGYDHYEISNFCLPGRESKHNSAYWKKANYLGIGPGAHSYDGQSRQANISNNRRYISGIESGSVPCEVELLSATDHINEYIMTQLRTKWGINLVEAKQQFGFDLIEQQAVLARWQSSGDLHWENGTVRLTQKGKHMADQIAGELFF